MAERLLARSVGAERARWSYQQTDLSNRIDRAFRLWISSEPGPADELSCFNPYVSMLECQGISLPRFGDSTEPLKGVLA